MGDLILYGGLGFVGLCILWKIFAWIGNAGEDRKIDKANREERERSDALDAEAKAAVGNDWTAQLGYKVKKNLQRLREIHAKDHPELYYRDEQGLLQDKAAKKKEEAKLKQLKTHAFKCKGCGAPLPMVAGSTRAVCVYCSTGNILVEEKA